MFSTHVNLVKTVYVVGTLGVGMVLYFVKIVWSFKGGVVHEGGGITIVEIGPWHSSVGTLGSWDVSRVVHYP